MNIQSDEISNEAFPFEPYLRMTDRKHDLKSPSRKLNEQRWLNRLTKRPKQISDYLRRFDQTPRDPK